MEWTCVGCGKDFEAAADAPFPPLCPECARGKRCGPADPGLPGTVPDRSREEEEEFDDLLFGGAAGFFNDFLPPH